MEPTFFATPADFRAWMEDHHEQEQELLVGFYKKDSGKPSITWPESVDVALCYGWIDGVRKGRDETSYTIRFTPRKPRSTWSAVNIKKVEDLTAQGLMRPAGIKAFEARNEDNSVIYAYEQENPTLDAASEQIFRANEQAWQFFQSLPASYQKMAVWWVISAKRDDTRQKRLATLIADSEQGRTLKQFARVTK
jgi:uncharacterized protein YdeI (YjbR/CyaY-like superfamily)